MTYDLVSERRGPEVKVKQPEDVFAVIQRYGTKKQEHFLVVTLDGNQQILKVHIVSIGLLNRTLVHPREVFVRAIKDHAASIVVAHNHPSGQLDPSPEDIDVTKRLKECGELLGIPLLDHLIISSTKFLSFKIEGRVLS